MAEAKGGDDRAKAAIGAEGLAELADTSARIFAQQTAMMTMMTAYGLRMSSQIVGMMLGQMPTGDIGDAPKAAEPAGQDRTDSAPVARVVPLRVVPKTRTKPAPADDLKAINGIGPRLEKALHDKGISTFSEIAGWDEAAMQVVDKELGLGGRAIRDDWIGQARTLMKDKAATKRS